MNNLYVKVVTYDFSNHDWIVIYKHNKHEKHPNFILKRRFKKFDASVFQAHLSALIAMGAFLIPDCYNVDALVANFNRAFCRL